MGVNNTRPSENKQPLGSERRAVFALVGNQKKPHMDFNEKNEEIIQRNIETIKRNKEIIARLNILKEKLCR